MCVYGVNEFVLNTITRICFVIECCRKLVLKDIDRGCARFDANAFVLQAASAGAAVDQERLPVQSPLPADAPSVAPRPNNTLTPRSRIVDAPQVVTPDVAPLAMEILPLTYNDKVVSTILRTMVINFFSFKLKFFTDLFRCRFPINNGIYQVMTEVLRLDCRKSNTSTKFMKCYRRYFYSRPVIVESD